MALTITEKTNPVEIVRKHVEVAQNYMTKQMSDWQADWKLYRSYVDMTNRDKRRSNAFIPLVFPLIESACARYMLGIFGTSPLVSILPREPNDLQAAENREAALQYYLERAGIFLPMEKAAKLMLIFGDSFIVSSWRVKVQKVKKRVPVEEFGTVLGYKDEMHDEIVYDGLWHDVFPPYSCFPDPYSDDIGSARAVCFESYVPVSRLEEMKRQGMAGNLNKIDDYGTLGDSGGYRPIDRWKEVGYNEPEADSGMMKVWWYYADDHFYFVANEQTLIYDDANPYSHQVKPITQFTKVPQPGSFFGLSAIRPAARLQHQYNVLFDQVADRNNQTINPWIAYRADAGIDPNRLISSPNNRFPVQGDPASALYVHAVPSLTGDPIRMMDVIKSAFDEATGYFGYQRGYVEQKRTVGEANILNTQGDMRIKYDTMVFEKYQGMSHLAKVDAANVEQFMSPETRVRILNEGAMDWTTLSSEDIRGEFDYQFRGVTDSYNRDIDRAQLMEIFNLAANFPEVNRGEFLSMLFDAFPSMRVRKRQILMPPAPQGVPIQAGGMQSVGQTGAIANPNAFGATSNQFDVQQAAQPRVRAVA